jgi:hypothetical protein
VSTRRHLSLHLFSPSCLDFASNHLTFYVAQVTAVKIALGDTKGAADTVQKYFGSQFLDQIAQSGEQPFESVRTRPYHYRCFNLEAMIVSIYASKSIMICDADLMDD